MKPEYIFSIMAALMGFMLTQLFSHQIIGEWKKSFFMMPYDIAHYLVPVSCAFFAYIFAVRCYRNNIHNKSLVALGASVTLPVFFAYAVVHSVTVALVDSTQPFAAIFISAIVFGGILFLPVGLVLGVLAAFLASWTGTNKSLKL